MVCPVSQLRNSRGGGVDPRPPWALGGGQETLEGPWEDQEEERVFDICRSGLAVLKPGLLPERLVGNDRGVGSRDSRRKGR